MNPRRILPVLLAVLLVAAALGCRRAADEPAYDARQAFFERLATLCGQSFAGKAVHSATEDDPMMQARLTMHVDSCTAGEIRVPFHVDENRSRTWVLTRRDGGLLLKHDHRHEDGTPEELTMYGGWATEEGTSERQSFPADEETAQMLPAAATNVWTMEIHQGRQFVYDLQRHGQPRFRAEFDLSQPLQEQEPAAEAASAPP
jgi:hypothetical protein